MARSKKLEPMSLRLDPEVKAPLQEFAAADERTLSAYVNRVLRQHVDAMRRRPKAKSGDK
jgi:predicted transcriptional regulator